MRMISGKGRDVVRTAIAFVLSLAAFANPAYSCSVERVPSASELVSRAEVIVRVRAEGQAATKATGLGFLPGGSTQVRFLVLEILKGTLPAKTIAISGSLSEQHDPNDRPVPYDFVRPGGRHGNCFAITYRVGTEYLLMLARQSHPAYAESNDLTPYWAPLAATNEQVTGPDDRWLLWVRSAAGVSQRPPHGNREAQHRTRRGMRG